MSESLSKDSFTKISGFIYRKSGIFIEEEKHYKKLTKHINNRLSELKFDSFANYFFELRFNDDDGKEFQSLVNTITVNDTYFFREKSHFDILVDKILPEMHKKIPSQRAIRILSAPCSSGEEVYSILLHILEKGDILEKRDIEIVGIDIDSTVVQKAKTAKYCEQSIYPLDELLRLKWFSKYESHYKILDELKTHTDFHVVNVLDKKQMKELGEFDIIFSRNMLMYFDDVSRKNVAMTYYEMLKPEGYVFLGHTEDMNLIVSVFDAQTIDDSIVYKKQT